MWLLYILRCADDSLYVGETPDVAHRVAADPADVVEEVGLARASASDGVNSGTELPGVEFPVLV